VRLEAGDWQAEAVRAAIKEHNLKVQTRWLAARGDPARSAWAQVADITLRHLRPSRAWKKKLLADLTDSLPASSQGGRP
jgi:hypothetical protein